MMTRGGKKDGKEDQEGGASSSVDPGSTAESKTEGKLEELAGLGKMLVRAQATEDEQTKKASSIQECHWRSMQQQLSQIQQQVSMLREERRLRRQGKEGLRNRQVEAALIQAEEERTARKKLLEQEERLAKELDLINCETQREEKKKEAHHGASAAGGAGETAAGRAHGPEGQRGGRKI
ncbi:Reticulocyte-binding protein 2 like a [Dissostichus eleginoides]|uniref:Reticulocyte-binding protein 2 like a n=1 Tax=Dissostichus eleginoides TaxID=100907 RepID=A0AAD9BKM3_DISEL|nr:Reticulocyte-binding protein 2 like a [Dissostichus eleginoides]